MHRVEIAERDRQPARIGRLQRQCVAERGGANRDSSIANDVTIDGAVKKEPKRFTHRMPRRARAARRRCGPRSSTASARTIEAPSIAYNQLLMAASATQRARRPDVGGPSRRGDPRRRARVRAGGLAASTPTSRSTATCTTRSRRSTSRAPTPTPSGSIAHTLRDYRRAGVDKPPEVRARLKQIDEELTKLGQQFSKNISEDVRVDRGHGPGAARRAAGGLHRGAPARRERHDPDHDRLPRLQPVHDLRGRRRAAPASSTSSSAAAAISRTRRVLHDDPRAARREGDAARVRRLGRLHHRRQDDQERRRSAAEFIEKVWKLAAPRAERGLRRAAAPAAARSIRRRPRSPTGRRSGSRTSSRRSATRSMRARCASTSRTSACSRACSRSRRRSSTSRTCRCRRARAWHASVLVYDVMRAGAQARPHLPRHASARRQVQARGAVPAQGRRARRAAARGRARLQLPRADRSGGPALMEHDDVVTMFHEFGHLMHHVLGGHQRWITQSGVATEWDFVEAPSQMFEEWAWSHDTLARFARHHADRRGHPARRWSTRCAAPTSSASAPRPCSRSSTPRSRSASTAPIPTTLDQLGEVQAAAEAATRRSRTCRARGSTPRSATSWATRRCTTRTSGRS